MEESTFIELKKDLYKQINSNIRSRILVPDWKPFKNLVYEDPDLRLDDSMENEAYVVRVHNLPYFKMMLQTLFGGSYRIGSIKQGYAFSDFECLNCGSTGLFYDQHRERMYCPCND